MLVDNIDNSRRQSADECTLLNNAIANLKYDEYGYRVATSQLLTLVINVDTRLRSIT